MVTTSQKLEIAGTHRKAGQQRRAPFRQMSIRIDSKSKQESACEERLNQAHKHTVEALSNQADAFHQIAHDVRSTTYSYFKPRNGNEYISSDLEIKEFEVICRSVTRRVKKQSRGCIFGTSTGYSRITDWLRYCFLIHNCRTANKN